MEERWANDSSTCALRVRFKVVSGERPLSIEQLVRSCPAPDWQALNTHPEFQGMTIPPGEPNGIIAPYQPLPLDIALAAYRNQMLILITIDATYQDGFEGTPLHHSFDCIEITVDDPVKSIFSFVSLKFQND
jgi:hypothetical protein